MHEVFAFNYLPNARNLRLEPYDYALESKDGRRTSLYVVPDLERAAFSLNWGDRKSAVCSWSKQRVAALDFLTRLFTDREIANLLHYGREGVEYQRIGDAIQLLPHNQSFPPPGLMDPFANPLLSDSLPNEPADKVKHMQEYFSICEEKLPDGFRFDPAPVAEEIRTTNAVLNSYGEKALSADAKALLELNSDDPSRTIEAVMRELKAAGMDRVIEEANRQLRQWRNKQ